MTSRFDMESFISAVVVEEEKRHDVHDDNEDDEDNDGNDLDDELAEPMDHLIGTHRSQYTRNNEALRKRQQEAFLQRQTTRGVGLIGLAGIFVGIGDGRQRAGLVGGGLGRERAGRVLQPVVKTRHRGNAGARLAKGRASRVDVGYQALGGDLPDQACTTNGVRRQFHFVVRLDSQRCAQSGAEVPS